MEKKGTEKKNKKILIVDDEPDLRMMFKDILSTVGYETGEAEDGMECLEKMEKEKYDLVLLDLMMPRMDGMEALTRIKQDPDKYGKVPVLILTNLTSDVAIKEGFERKADGYLIKTELTPEQVIKEISGVFNGGKKK
ncbi:MAG: response regulator [Patescibacteria group bacterium]|nr:response regulator [Patescibacteria group bacterium]